MVVTTSLLSAHFLCREKYRSRLFGDSRKQMRSDFAKFWNLRLSSWLPTLLPSMYVMKSWLDRWPFLWRSRTKTVVYWSTKRGKGSDVSLQTFRKMIVLRRLLATLLHHFPVYCHDGYLIGWCNVNGTRNLNARILCEPRKNLMIV